MKPAYNAAYGTPQGLNKLQGPPIIPRPPRDPTVLDNQYNVGQVWVNDGTGTYWALTINSAGTTLWVDLGATGNPSIEFLTGNSGGQVGPDGSGNVNVVGDGSVVTIVGDAGTHTQTVAITGVVPVPHGGTGAATLTGVLTGNGTAAVTGNPITQHDVLVAGASNAITSVAPSATVGVPLVSQNATTDPHFGTATVPGGGTGDTSFVAYAPVCGGTTTTGSLQSVVSLETAGFVLTSNGPATLPSFQPTSIDFSSIVVQSFSTSGTYTPTAGMLYVTVEVQAAGGGGAGAAATSVGQVDVGGAGGGGGYSRKTFSAPTVGASQSITIGGGGAAGVGGNPGSAGGSSSFGVLFSATGGGGGAYSLPPNAIALEGGGTGGVGIGGDFNVTGSSGGNSFGIFFGDGTVFSGSAGSGYFGGGGVANGAIGTSANGFAGGNYGGGGTGGVSGSSSGTPAGTANGGAGAGGLIVCTEFIG